MATTIERSQVTQVVAHATEYPADREGDGTGYGGKQKSTAERQDQDTGSPDEVPAVFIDEHHTENHVLDGMAAYQAAALEVMEPGIDHGPSHPLPGPVDKVPPQNVLHAYGDRSEDGEPSHEVNVAT
jgi:hypothetical protein